MAAHRLFLALAPDEGVRQQILEVAAALPDGGVRRIRADKLHLTLAFLGNVDPAAASAAGARAARQVAAFGFELDEVGSFHAATWFLRAPPGPFLPLMQALDRELRAAGLPANRESLPFVPHVTVARGQAQALPRAPIAPVRWQAREICLYDSFLDTGAYQVRSIAALGVR